MPKISVVIPLYNHEKYIYRTISSVLNQSYSDLELIIINDGSIDGSEEVVKDIKDERIKYFYQENKGAYKTINRGISLSKGDYISILNSDDIYCNDRLTECLRVIEANKQLSAVFSEVEFIDENDQSMEILRAPEEIFSNFYFDHTFTGEEEIFLKLLMGNFLVSTSNLFCRREVFDKIGYFSNFQFAHDYEFFLRLSYHCKVFHIKTPLLKYRIHSLSSFKANEAETQFEVAIILKDVILKYLIKKGDEDKRIDNLLYLFNFLNTSNAERVMMILFLMHLISPDIADRITKDLIENSDHSFRLAFIERLKTQLNLWKYSQEAWNSWRETNERLIKTYREIQNKEKELNISNEKITFLQNELNRLNEFNKAIINSYSFRIGKVITWPMREIFKLLRK